MSGSTLLFKAFEAKPPGARSGLHQGEWWRDVQGGWHKIESMPLGYVESVMAFLLRCARHLADREAYVLIGFTASAGEHAADAIDMEIDEMTRDFERWLKSTTLYRALKKRRKVLRKAIKRANKKASA